jgi:hypothetical protein
VIATGSDRRASRIAGLSTDRIIIGVFAASGASAALAGVLLSYSLGAASPVALADVLAPAAAAAIVGGVSVGGGRGSPMGIAAGVLTLCILRSGLSAIGVEPHVHDLVTGTILVVIATVDAPDLARRPEQERAVIRRTLDTYEQTVGKPAKAWLSSAVRGTAHTPAFLKEFGLIAYCDYLNDDQPYLIDTVHGPIVCVPYSNDINDFNMFARGGLSTRDGVDMLKLCFDQLHAEGAATGRIMNVGLHPHVIGQPHRIAALREFIEYVKGKSNVWFPTREQIATWYLAQVPRHVRHSS